jgi:hypothetical protein
MTEPIPFMIRVNATNKGQKSNLTIAELGVVLTAINRALNKAAALPIPSQGFVARSSVVGFIWIILKVRCPI